MRDRPTWLPWQRAWQDALYGAHGFYRRAEGPAGHFATAVQGAPVLGELPAPRGPLAWASAILPVAAFAALAVVHALLPALGRTSAGRAFHIHALHGFYFGLLADRAVDRIWRSFAAGRI